MIYPIPFPHIVEEFADHLQQEVPSRTAKLIAEGVSEVKAWTKPMKTVLAELGKTHAGFRSIYTDRSENMRKFMLDFIWWSDNGAMLACECEWGNSWNPKSNPQAVADDFDKLLSFKAPMKLMIFDSYADATLQSECLSLLDKYLAQYPSHIEGEQYLLIDFCKEFRAWTVTVKKHGLDPSLAFTTLA